MMAATEAKQAYERLAATLDPELIMAVRDGDSNRLMQLLPHLKPQPAYATAASTEEGVAVVLEVYRGPTAAVDAAAKPFPCGGAAAAASSWALDGVTLNEGDSLLHIVVAACGDGDKLLRCAKMIYNGKSDLLAKRNNKGETPLHCAAGAGNAKMIASLLDLAPTVVVQDLLRLRNECGETALHKAVSAASTACIDELLLRDPELGCFPQEGDGSPLYLAISLGYMKIAKHLFVASNRKLSYSGPHGRNVLHAAVSRIEVLTELLKMLKRETVDVKHGDCHVSVPLLLHLTKQRDKQTGSTPLHLAASFTGWPFLRLPSRWFPRFRLVSEKAAELLLNAVGDDEDTPCRSSLYQPDNEGLYPIHVAAMTGCRAVVEFLIERFPDCATLRDGKGRTFLHVAVEMERYSVVRYACKSPKCLSILNVQDRNGDTALHRAVDVGNLAIFNRLMKNKRVRLDVSNKEGVKPRDLSFSKIHPGLYYMSTNSRRLIRTSLSLLSATCGESRPDIFSRKHFPSIDDDDDYRKHMKDLASTAQATSVVAALVATVAFASAFSLPGGYRADGTPVLAGSYVFDVFIMADAMAFMCAMAAACSLVYAGVSAMDRFNRVWYMQFAENLLLNAVRSFGTAFCWGLFVMLAPVTLTTTLMTTALLWMCALYGNMEGRQILRVLNTARVRKMGIPISAHVLVFFRFFVRHYSGKTIAYGLPAIPRIIKLLHNKLS